MSVFFFPQLTLFEQKRPYHTPLQERSDHMHIYTPEILLHFNHIHSCKGVGRSLSRQNVCKNFIRNLDELPWIDVEDFTDSTTNCS